MGEGIDLSREHMIVTIVVRDATHVRGIAQRERRIRLTVFLEPAREFLGKMHRIAHASSVPAGENSTPAFECIGDGSGSFLHRVESRGIAGEHVEHFLRALERRLKFCPHSPEFSGIRPHLRQNSPAHSV